MWFYKNGVKTYVCVDNYLPVTSRGTPIFAKSQGNELWPAIAEKCYAKYHKGYCIIEGGNTGPTMRELTGAPTYMFNFNREHPPKDKDGLWEKIFEGEKKDYGMSAGTDGKDEGELDDNGIVPGHAYTLIAAKEITNKNGQPEKLVKLRNPWKEGEWKGRYSDNSDEWTASLRKELNHEAEDDGIFWMTYEDMITAYGCIDICKIDDANSFSYLKVSDTKGFNVIKFKYLKKSDGKHLTTFAVSQKDCRAEEADGNSNFDLNSYTRSVDVKFVKVQDEKLGNIFVEGNCQKIEGLKDESLYPLRETYTEFEKFDAGTYYMYVKIEWNGNAATKDYAVNSYSPQKVNWLTDDTENWNLEQVKKLFLDME